MRRAARGVVGEAANASQALVWLATRSCDLLLLDVQMPGRDGTQLAAELRLARPAPAVVFVTAHAEHALKAFDLEAVDYLTKPVKRERLQAALQPRRPAPGRAAAPRRRRGRGRGPGDRRQRPRPDHPRAGRRRAVPEGRAQVRDLCARPSTPTCSTTRSPSSRSGSATASCASTATRWSPAVRCARSSAARSPAKATTTASKAGPSASRRSRNGWRCRGARSPRCARRWSRRALEFRRGRGAPATPLGRFVAVENPRPRLATCAARSRERVAAGRARDVAPASSVWPALDRGASMPCAAVVLGVARRRDRCVADRSCRGPRHIGSGVGDPGLVEVCGLGWVE